jgi:hypothetical protein
MPGKSSAPAAANNIRAISDKIEQDAAPKQLGYVRVHPAFPRFALPVSHYHGLSITFPEAQLCFVFS